MTRREQLLNICSATEGVALDFSSDDVIAALGRLKRKAKLDRDGISIAALQVIAECRPEPLTRLINKIASDSTLCRRRCVYGYVRGKVSPNSPLSQLRAILPLGVVWQVLDVLIADRLNLDIDMIFQTNPSTFVGGQPRTQVLDIAAGIQLVVEKSLDRKSQGAVAQADIRTYYDRIPMVRIAYFLLHAGVSPLLVGAILRHQLLPSVELGEAGMAARINVRSKGGLTGSRVAGACGRIPVEDTLKMLDRECSHLGFRVGSGVLTVSSYIDNLYAVSDSLFGAISLMKRAEQHLLTRWDLDFKPDSKKCMVPRGSQQGVSDRLIQEYPLNPTFDVLGHRVADDCSIAPCFRRTKAAMW